MPGISEIGAFISLVETESSSRVIASPRVVTQNKETASISSGQTIFVGGVGGAQNAINANLNLAVTPQVTNDGAILLKISFTNDVPEANPAIAGSVTIDSKSITTSVVVDSGGTIVIGGVYSSNSTNTEAGIPILRNLPIIGPFFGSKTKSLKKDELFIFITPRVLNDKESGIKS
ncbi:MAG: type II and III secretion system protein [Deltaproteobacteria bacterium]|nr:type II and III secretion system protein [Deltaproteobacteria bacterium]